MAEHASSNSLMPVWIVHPPKCLDYCKSAIFNCNFNLAIIAGGQSLLYLSDS